MRSLTLRALVALPLVLFACGGGDDTDDAATTQGTGGSAGSSAGGSAGSAAGGAAGTAGSAGKATGGAAGTAGSATGGTAGAAGAAGSGGSTAGSGGAAAGSGGSSAGSGGSTAGSGGSTAGSGGSTAGSGGAAAGAGGSAAGSGGGGPATGIFATPQKPHTFTYRIAKPYTETETSTFEVIGLDLFENTKATIGALKAKGKTVVCYFSGTYEEWRPDYMALTSAADKAALDALQAGPLDNWPGEQWVDLHGFSPTSPSDAHKLLRKIMGDRVLLAKDKGCDAVDFDNVNEQENAVKNKAGQAITALDQLAYNTWLADQAHASSMKAFLKNDLSQIADDASYPGGKGLAQIFDGAINEQCFEFDECDQMMPFRDLAKPIFVIQYKYGSFPTAAQKATANTLHLNVSYYAKDAMTALASDPDQTFGTW